MNDPSRELIAYSIIGALLIVAVPWLVIAMRRRQRKRLRRRGIKRYGH